MARKKTLEELQTEREKAEQDLRMRQENLKKLKQKEAELTRSQRTHRLCTHGDILEQYISTDEFTDEQSDRILKAIFRRSETIEMLQSVKRQAESQSETYEVPYCVRAQLYTPLSVQLRSSPDGRLQLGSHPSARLPSLGTLPLSLRRLCLLPFCTLRHAPAFRGAGS